MKPRSPRPASRRPASPQRRPRPEAAAPRPEGRSPRPGLPRINAGQRFGAALDLLEGIAGSRSGADRVAAAWFNSHAMFDGPHRADIMELVEAVLRHRAALDWWIQRLGQGLNPASRLRLITAHVLLHRREPSSLETAFDGKGFAPSPLDEAEKRLLLALRGHTIAHPDMPAHVRLGVPAWLEPLLRQSLGAAMEQEMAALLAPAALDLRVNTLRGTRDEAAAKLRDAGFVPRTTPLSPLGLRLPDGTDVAKLEPLRSGLVEVQDEGSQIAALLVDAQPGEWVVDFCAGAGGKSMVLAAAMQNRGHLVALDINEKRLVRARQRLRRAGAENAECRETDPKWIKRHAGRAARVLVDAPCSGTGTWRRKPDARWRLAESEIAELTALQAQILDSAQRLVKPGGRLVYVTCSLLDVENDGQVQAFLSRHPDFTVVPVSDLWPQTIGGAAPDRSAFLHLTPHRHGTDGFFVAVLQRAG